MSQGHVSFASSHPGKAAGDSVMADGVEQQLFPEHCIQGSEGAQYPEGLQLDRFHRTFHKGTDVSLDCFSAFYDTAHNATGVGQYLKERSVEVRLAAPHLSQDGSQASQAVLGASVQGHARSHGLLQEVYIAGLVTETCIKATTLDALKEGSYAAVALIADVCRGMQSPQDESADFKEMEARGARIVSVQDCT